MPGLTNPSGLNPNTSEPPSAGLALGGSALGALISIGGGLILANQQEKSNLELARYQAEANERYLKQQLEYNSPANQMKRFMEAGLNPHLIYGQGSPGNQSQPLTYPDIGRVDQRLITSLIPLINQTRLTESQVAATDATTRQRTVLTELSKLQMEVLRRNPALDDEGYKAILDSLRSAASIKASEASLKKLEAEWSTGVMTWKNLDGTEVTGPPGAYKLQREVDLLDSRFKLSRLDQQLRNQVLLSKEFQNAILEVQKKWMTDADITPQHIYQLIQILLMKSF